VVARVKECNAGCQPEKEVLRVALFKEVANLNISDYAEFNAWLLEVEKPTFRQVKEKIQELRKRRWAIWHIMAPDNPRVADECSMPHPVSLASGP
jgi:hypothetical protein